MSTVDVNEGDWRSACEALSIAFANGVDHRRYDEVAALFTEDGILNRWGQAIAGRVELRAWLDTRPTNIATRHVCTNFEARRIAPEHAEGFTLFTFYRGAGTDEGGAAIALAGPAMVGEYLDQFRLTQDGWRIARRDIRVVFQSPE